MIKKPLAIMAIITAMFIAPIAHAGTSLYYTFNTDGVLQEAWPMSASPSPYFWLDSGAYFFIQGGQGGTTQGPLPANDPWRLLYAVNNPVDTGNGYYPQNLFRFVTKSTWTNLSEELPFEIDKVNLTDTPNRDMYSGVLLFSRYSGDGQNTYYAGVRQDGTAVIKKKIRVKPTDSGGTYFTMIQTQPIWSNGKPYDKWNNPNLIPVGKWMALKLDTINQSNGSVTLSLYLDQNYVPGPSHNWVLVATASDAPGKYRGTPILPAAYAGIRTDYMDVTFDNYRLTER